MESVLFATFLLPLLTLAVRALGFLPCRRLLGATLHVRPLALEADVAVDRARRIASMVDLAGERTSLLLADCLPRALVLWWLCRRARIDAALRLGARTLTGRFEAHAWVEVAGRPVGEEEAVEKIYTAFDLDARLSRETRS